MQGYDQTAACDYILFKLDKKPFRAIRDELPAIIRSFITYDLHFMRLTGVIDQNGQQGEQEYDDDEAFEYIYDAWLSDHPDHDDEDMTVAELLNCYMELQYQYLCENGLADV